MNQLQRGRFFFFVGALMFFSGVASIGILGTYGKTGSDYMGIGIAISGIGMMIGLPLLMLAGAILFKNRRTR